MVSNAVPIRALKSPRTQTIIKWFIQTCWISSLMLSVLMSLGSVILPVSRQARVGYIELYYNQTRIQKGLGYKSPGQVWFDYYRQAA